MAMFSSLFSLLSLITCIIFICFKWISFLSKTKRNLPPSPRKLPVIGNLHQLGSSPQRSLQALSRKHGPLMLIHLGSVPILVASSADVAREIMKTHDLIFSSRPKLTMAEILFYGSKDIVFSPSGEQWRKTLKSIASFQLLNNTRVKSFRHVREEEMALMIGMIEESYGSIVDLTKFIVTYTRNVVCRVVIGRPHNGPNLTNLLATFPELLGVFNVGNYIPWLSWIDRLSGLKGRAEKVAKQLDELLEGIIEDHQRIDSESDETRDFVHILLDIQKSNATEFTLHRDTVKAVILDIFSAGTDTTVTNIEWAMSELIKHPRVMKRLQKEITEIAQGRSMITEHDLEKMKYLKAVLKESLRLHPPGPLLIPHESTQDVKLMGYDIPAGTQVIINAWAIGRDPTFWEESEEFRPERFLESSIDYKGLHFELLPFGAGRRGCPGIQFAVLVSELALANVVYKFNFALPNGDRDEDLDMSETPGLVVHKTSSLLVIPTPRF